jgi:DNA topoisomerase II
MDKTLEQKYRKLTDVDHVLLRSGMYIGSVKPHTEEIFLLDESEKKFKLNEITYNPGFLKLFDEIVSNSVDEHKRNSKLNQIKITVDQSSGTISVWDNGGIPVEIHKEYNEWVPEMIFSNLKTGSNFDDSEDRVVVGTNGVGSTLTNIFSKEFIVETADGKKSFRQVFSKNMSQKTEPEIKGSKKNFTQITFTADLARFGLSEIDSYHFKMIQKRLYDIAACNTSLKVYLNDIQISFSSFLEYTKLYIDNVFYENSQHWKIGVGHSSTGFKSISFVNSVETKDGGTHVNHIAGQIIHYLREKIKKKYKVDVKPTELKQHMFIFIDCTVINPSFSSQTKEKLITEPKDYGTSHKLSEKTLKLILNSEITKSVLDWIERKRAAEEKANLRKLNLNIDKTKVLKLIDAKKSGDRKDCTLSLFEGDSAISAFRRYRDPMTQGAFPLRGKFINVREIPDSKVLQNKEVQSLMSAIGLKIGHPPKNIRYGRILFYTDSDVDGNAISALLINFFGKYWPDLFKEEKIFKVETPLMVAKKGKETLSFYTEEEYLKWESVQKNLKSWSIEYKKGLAALEDEEYKEIIKNPRYFTLTKDAEFEKILEIWFSGDSEPRKNKILGHSIETVNTKSLF